MRERDQEELARSLVREAEGSVAEAERRARSEPGPSVVEIKRYDMTPMFEEDAILRMEELGHAFFVFLNAETDRHRRGLPPRRRGLRDDRAGRAVGRAS